MTTRPIPPPRAPRLPCADGCPGLGRRVPGARRVCPPHAGQHPGSWPARHRRRDRLGREVLVGCQGL